MYNNGDYEATCTYHHHSDSGIVSRHLISCHSVNITCYTLLVYTNVHNKIRFAAMIMNVLIMMINV